MSDTFPKNRIEALAMLYMQNQDLKDKTPEELVVMYDKALSAIFAESKKIWEKERNDRLVN